MPGLFSMFNNGAMRPPVSYGPGADPNQLGNLVPGTAMGTGQLQPMGPGGIAPVLRGAGPMATTNMGAGIGNLGMPGGMPVPAMGQAGNDIMSKLKMQGMRQRLGGLGPQLLAQGARPGGLMSMFGQAAQMFPQRQPPPVAGAGAIGAGAGGGGGGLLGSIGSLFGRR